MMKLKGTESFFFITILAIELEFFVGLLAGLSPVITIPLIGISGLVSLFMYIFISYKHLKEITSHFAVSAFFIFSEEEWFYADALIDSYNEMNITSLETEKFEMSDEFLKRFDELTKLYPLEFPVFLKTAKQRYLYYQLKNRTTPEVFDEAIRKITSEIKKNKNADVEKLLKNEIARTVMAVSGPLPIAAENIKKEEETERPNETETKPEETAETEGGWVIGGGTDTGSGQEHELDENKLPGAIAGVSIKKLAGKVIIAAFIFIPVVIAVSVFLSDRIHVFVIFFTLAFCSVILIPLGIIYHRADGVGKEMIETALAEMPEKDRNLYLYKILIPYFPVHVLTHIKLINDDLGFKEFYVITQMPFLQAVNFHKYQIYYRGYFYDALTTPLVLEYIGSFHDDIPVFYSRFNPGMIGKDIFTGLTKEALIDLRIKTYYSLMCESRAKQSIKDDIIEQLRTEVEGWKNWASEKTQRIFLSSDVIRTLRKTLRRTAEETEEEEQVPVYEPPAYQKYLLFVMIGIIIVFILFVVFSLA